MGGHDAETAGHDEPKSAVGHDDRNDRSRCRNRRSRWAEIRNYLFDPDFCNVASGWEKGVVEKNVQDSRRRIWLAAREQRFGS
ncbi:IS21 family transposase, partial [Roseateles sp. BYS78W]